MRWWQWAAATVEGVLLLVLLLLWFDSLRDRAGWTNSRAAARAASGAVVVPAGFIAVLLVPLWLGLILIAVPAIAVGVMAMAS